MFLWGYDGRRCNTEGRSCHPYVGESIQSAVGVRWFTQQSMNARYPICLADHRKMCEEWKVDEQAKAFHCFYEHRHCVFDTSTRSWRWPWNAGLGMHIRRRSLESPQQKCAVFLFAEHEPWMIEKTTSILHSLGPC